MKSKEVFNHVYDLRKVTRYKQYKLRMSPLKCVFGISSGVFLGFTIHKKEIDLNPTKVI